MGATARSIYGLNTSTSGTVYGIYGRTTSTQGTAICGEVISPAGSSRFQSGVHGLVQGMFGVGVKGSALGSTNRSIGVHGLSEGNTGVLGEGRVYGVYGRTTNTQGTAVFGEVVSQGPSTTAQYGVHGLVQGRYGVGVKGSAVGSTTGNYSVGVFGSSERYTGVRGEGRIYGVYGTSSFYGVFASGRLGASGTKSFVQPHPTDPSKTVQFICLEGNESGTYFRGSTRVLNGVAEIEIPKEWQEVTAAEGITVVATPTSGFAMLCVTTRTRERIVVRGSADVEFDYIVNGVRRGFAKYEPYEENRGFRPEIRGVPFGSQYPQELRDILVKNGILNADYTPNETTAQKLGWELVNPDDVPIRERYWLSAGERSRLLAAQRAGQSR